MKHLFLILILSIPLFAKADDGDVYFCDVTFRQIVQGVDPLPMSQKVNEKFKFKWDNKKLKSNYSWLDGINFFKKKSNEKFIAASIDDLSIRTILFDGKYLTITGNSFRFIDSRTDTIRAECDKF
tara:strand:- start:447 stop:821 length:375 start_codon:yes stop_codon:yes gene_type:complete